MQKLLAEQRSTAEAALAQAAASWEEERATLEAEIRDLRAKMVGAAEAPPALATAPASPVKKSTSAPIPKKEEKRDKKSASLLGDFDVDEHSGVPVGEQLRQALVSKGGRVIDLFREWDTDGDGETPRE